jgi:hypothetical protein
LDKAVDLGRACNLVGDQDVADTVSSQRFRLAQGGACDANRSMGQLPPGERHTFVVLIVRAQAAWAFGEERSHVLEIGFHGVHVEQKSRSGYFGFQQGALSLIRGR